MARLDFRLARFALFCSLGLVWLDFGLDVPDLGDVIIAAAFGLGVPDLGDVTTVAASGVLDLAEVTVTVVAVDGGGAIWFGSWFGWRHPTVSPSQVSWVAGVDLL